MISSRKELEYFLEQDRLADNIVQTPAIFWGGGYAKKLQLFKIYLRKCEYHSNVMGFVHSILAKYYSVRKNRLGGQLGISISINSFGPGLSIPHYGTIVVNSAAKIGSGCRILPDVIIGKNGEDDTIPVIGDHVYLGAGAKIIGKVCVGNNVCVGANAVVVKDIPDNATVVGVPAKVINYNGSFRYLSKLID